jgi:hypothetical protein
MRPEILTIMQGGAYGGWDQVARELLLLHKAQKGF